MANVIVVPRVVEKIVPVDKKVLRTVEVEVIKEVPEFTNDPNIAKPENNPVKLRH